MIPIMKIQTITNPVKLIFITFFHLLLILLLLYFDPKYLKIIIV